MKLRIVLLTHPPTFGTTSMPRFAGMILRGMLDRGHSVELWTSRQTFGRLPVRSALARKWLGYVDQFAVYPRHLRKLVNKQSPETVFVVTDQALGMWVPCLAHRPHVIHCHDFLALKSARGEFPENRTGWTGQQYQRLILRGFSKGNAFVSVSKKTQDDLHGFLGAHPKISEMVHNGLNYPFRPMPLNERMGHLSKVASVPKEGFVLHLSGNQWYKNPRGVLEIYRAYANSTRHPVPLWMVGLFPSDELAAIGAPIPSPGKVEFVTGLNNEQINAAYAHARALLFPSLEEGFGWPIIEAMAADCPVVTTDAAPMTEVAGGAARLIPRMPSGGPEQKAWANAAAVVMDELVRMDTDAREKWLAKGRANVTRFDANRALDSYERIYRQVLANLK
jgi:glycosyltransferase involved in cell wall biosynthesis